MNSSDIKPKYTILCKTNKQQFKVLSEMIKDDNEKLMCFFLNLVSTFNKSENTELKQQQNKWLAKVCGWVRASHINHWTSALHRETYIYLGTRYNQITY